MSRYVGIGLHRRRSVVVILDRDGSKVSSRRIDNSLLELAAAVAWPVLILKSCWKPHWGGIGQPMCS